MACYHPLTAWYSKHVNDSGKRSLVFDVKNAIDDESIEVSCGQCIGCRLERSRQWAIRCVHEASLHEDNCFITLTFNDDELKKRENMWSLDVRDYQLFMKRLRKRFGNNIRFFHCGEYGNAENTPDGVSVGRPHYHACLFNFDFPDKKLWKMVNGHRLYTSESLAELWPYGFVTIGDVTFESAAYVARYIMKKVNGDDAEQHYTVHNPNTGEIHYNLKPEYTTMSRRPGIAAKWVEKYHSDVYPSDFITINGKKMKPPKFYDRIMEQTRPFEFDDIKDKRCENMEKNQSENTPARLQVKEKLQSLRLDKLPRKEI